jgi:hypothetical protein
MAKRPKYELRTERLVLTPPAHLDPEPELPSRAKAVPTVPDWQIKLEQAKLKQERKAAQRRGEIPSTTSHTIYKGMLIASAGFWAIKLFGRMFPRQGGRSGPFSTPGVN